MDFDGMKISLFVMFVPVFFIHKNNFQNKFCVLKRLCLKFYNIQEAERCCWKKVSIFYSYTALWWQHDNRQQGFEKHSHESLLLPKQPRSDWLTPSNAKIFTTI